jgi:HlyD family secretion protein
MKNKLRLLFGLIVIAAIVTAAIFFIRQRPVTVAVARVEQNIPIQVFGLGTVEAHILSKIGFQATGTVEELLVDQGALVKKGDVLARLDMSEQKARLAKARAGLVTARAGIKSASAALTKAKTLLTLKEKINARRQALLARGATTAEAADNSASEEEIARAEWLIAKSNIVLAEAALETAQAEYDYQKILLDNFTLRAPYDALIVARTKETGAVLGPGEPLFTLVKPDSVWILGYIDEGRAGGMKLGQPVEIHLRSLPGREFHGKVVRIDIESDRVNEERRVYARCSDCPEVFHLGEQSEVIITTAMVKSALLVPENAVSSHDSRAKTGTVWVVRGGRVARQKVHFGHITLDARLEITSGLQDGDKVIIRLPAGLRENRAARIQEQETR